MSDFNLGSIRVVDNGDGVYHYPVAGAKKIQDKIVDGHGKVLKPYASEVKAVLKELGIRYLHGLNLNPASRYLQNLQLAEKEALSGNTRMVQDSLRIARQAADLGKFPFAEKRAEAALTTSLKNELDLIVQRAEKLADQGKVVELRDAFNGARDILSRLRVPLDQAKAQNLPFTPELITKLEHKAMVQALGPLWTQAQAYAKSGNVERTQEAIRCFKEYSLLTQTTLTPKRKKRLKALLTQAYANSIDSHFKQANQKAVAGDVPGTRLYLNRAKEAVQYAGQTWTQSREDRAKKLVDKALLCSPVFLFAEAGQQAMKGEVGQVRKLIQQARDYRKILGKPLSVSYEKLSELLKEQALIRSVDVLLGKAGKQVSFIKKKGDMTQLYAYLAEARKNAKLAKIQLSAAQETSINQILDQAFTAAIAWRFDNAEHSAKLGKVDDTYVPLNEARALAKRRQLTFDKLKAKQLEDLALANGIELHFKAAESFAQKGDKDNVYFHLSTVRDYYRRLGTTYDKKRGQGILKLLKNSNP